MDDLYLVRAQPGLEFRSADDGIGLLTGHFSTFNSWYEIDSIFEGLFLERTAPGAFTQTLTEDRQVVLFNHGFDPQVGDKVLGTPSVVEERDKGPYYEVPLFDTSYNRDLLPGLKGGAYGSSFRFRVMAESWDEEPGVSDHNPMGLPERTITRAQVPEFGPVTFPANPAADAGARSLTDEFYTQLLRHQPDRYTELAERAKTHRSAGRSGARSTDGGAENDAINRARHRELRLKGIVA